MIYLKLIINKSSRKNPNVTLVYILNEQQNLHLLKLII